MAKPLSNDLAHIRHLEQKLGIEIKEVEIDDIRFVEIEKSYALADDQKTVIALRLDDNNIKNITELGLDNLTSLRTLHLSANQISKIEGLDNLTSLSELYLFYNQISKLEGLDKLTSLSSLNLSENHISKAEGLDKLTSLSELYLSSNQISKIEGLDKLTSLRTLYLSYNKISKIEGLDNLTSLRTLHLSENQISKIESLDKLTSLSKLDLSVNRISKIESLDKLTSLSTLSLYHNQISKLEGLDKLIDCKNLARIDLSYNQIKMIPLTVAEFAKEKHLNIITEVKFWPNLKKEINLYENPLENPKLAIIRQGTDAILRYLEAESTGELVLLNEIKVILVGEGHSGKTTLMNRLIKDTFNPNEEETHGANLLNAILDDKDYFLDCEKNNVKEDDMLARFWDFGGQETQYFLHELFLTDDSIYVLVYEERSSSNVKDYILRLWLRLIESIAPNDSVILVKTQCLESSSKNNIDTTKIFKRFKNIEKDMFYEIDCKPKTENEKGNDYLKFKKQLYNLIKKKIQEKKVPKEWVELKKQLDKDTRPHLKKSQYKKICKKLNIDSTKDKTAAGIMKQLGIAIHFDQPHMRNYYILEPHWALNGIYQISEADIFNDRDAEEGVFKVSKLYKLMADTQHKYYGNFKYNKDDVDYLIDLMKHSQLAFSDDKQEDESIIIPNRITSNTPKDLDKYFTEDEGYLTLRYVFEYRILKRGVMGKIITKFKDETILRYRNGVVFEKECVKAKAFIEQDTTNDKIIVKVVGEMRKEYFNYVILDEIRKINQSFQPSLEPKEKITVLGEIDNEEVEFDISYDALINKEEKLKSNGKKINIEDRIFENDEGVEYDLIDAIDSIKPTDEDTFRQRSLDNQEIMKRSQRSIKKDTEVIIGKLEDLEPIIKEGIENLAKQNNEYKTEILEFQEKIKNEKDTKKKESLCKKFWNNLIEEFKNDINKGSYNLIKEVSKKAGQELLKYTWNANKEKIIPLLIKLIPVITISKLFQ